MEQKLQFIQLFLTGEFTVKGLCVAFGISRTTGYNFIEKYDQIGEEAFREESKAPLSIQHKTHIRIENKKIKVTLK